MHRAVLARKLGKVLTTDEKCDHVNGDGLDNRRENIRLATTAQNGSNRRGPASNNKSGYLGVHYRKQRRKWVAEIRVSGKSVHLGYHDTADEAARAREEYIAHRPGLFARSNFPPSHQVVPEEGLST